MPPRPWARQENLLEIFRLLVQAGREGMAAGQVAEKLRLAQSHRSKRPTRQKEYAT